MSKKTLLSTFNNYRTDDMQNRSILSHEKDLENAYREAIDNSTA